MKKLFLFLGAASIIGVGSAFTAQQMVPPTSGTYVIDQSTGTYVLESTLDGDCREEPGICSWTKTGDEPGEQMDEYKNPDNFTQADLGHFVEN